MTTVWILDDDPHWLQFATDTLAGDGYEVSTDTGDMALVSDLNLTVAPGIPFVVFTSQPTVAGATEAYRAGAVDYLTKEFQGGKLLIVVRELVE